MKESSDLQQRVRELEHQVLLLKEDLTRSRFREEQWHKLCLLECQRSATLYRMLPNRRPQEEAPATSGSTRGSSPPLFSPGVPPLARSSPVPFRSPGPAPRAAGEGRIICPWPFPFPSWKKAVRNGGYGSGFGEASVPGRNTTKTASAKADYTSWRTVSIHYPSAGKPALLICSGRIDTGHRPPYTECILQHRVGFCA